MRRIAFINEKGGTGKTTLAVNVAAYLAMHKQMRVLLVDLDTQGHAGKALGLDVRGISPNVFHLLSDPEVTLQQVIHPSAIPGLEVIPSYKQMSEFPVVAHARPRKEHLLAARIEEAAALGYGAVVFDAPPSLGLTTINILCAASEIVVPVALSYLSLDGCAEVVDTVRLVAEQHGRSQLRVTRVVPTLYRKTALADAILAKLHEYFPHEVARTPLALNVKIDEAQSHGQTIFEYAPTSKGAALLAEIAEELYLAGATGAQRASA
ncbi:MAG: ParA family protein [Myxococcota bacterium]|nr:ParA family protein [Myxococcota bacterium]